MLRIDTDQLIEGVTVYRDEDKFWVFYPLPEQPRYRLDAQGRPSFGFYKYRFPVDRPDGKKGGGFLIFDVEFVVDPAVLQKVKDALTDQVAAEAQRRGMSPVPEVEFGRFTYTKGTNALLFPQSMVERFVPNGGKPSLVGNMVSAFALELSPEGATFFEQAMQSQGGAVSVIYDLWFWAKLPEVRVSAYWNATKFYSFYQTIDIEWNLWSEDDYRETLREQMIQSESMSITIDSDAPIEPKVRESLRSWAQKALEDAVQRNMITAIAPVPADQRDAPDGIENVTRDISSTQISSVYISFREAQTVEWNAIPQGILANITSLKDAGGAALKWSDYARTIDLDDPFFKQLRVNTYVNASFDELPIHSVEVKLLYKDRPMANLTEGEPEGEVVMNSPDDVGKFATYVEGDNWKYKYSYQVNYRGVARQYQSPEIETNEGTLTIGVDDVGLLDVNASAGDLNWSELDRVAVTLKYEDDDVDPFEEQFQLTQAAPNHQIQQVIFQPMRKNYRYQARYYMKGGKEFQGPELEGRSRQLYVNDVFDGRRTVSVRGVGDFGAKISTVFVDLTYEDAGNGYTIPSGSRALTAASQFFDWTFPVIDPDAGKITYKATVAYKDGTNQDIPETVATSNTILLPPTTEAFLEVQLVTDLLDWTAVKLVRASMSYADTAHDVSTAKDFIFSPTNAASQTWKVDLKDRQLDTYKYLVTFFFPDGRKKDVSHDTHERSLILDPAMV